MILVSTSSIRAAALPDLVRLARENGLPGLELNVVPDFHPAHLESLVADRGSLPVTVHNYFPPPEEPFILNLASLDQEVRDQSLDHCRRAIDLSARLGAGFFSAHAGFTYDLPPSCLGRPVIQAELPMRLFNDPDRCREVMAQSARTLARYGAGQGVRFLIENNVSAAAVGRTGPRLFLGLTAQDLLQLVEEVAHPNFGLLVDVGHLNVSAQALDFNRHEFIDLVGPCISAWHLSRNDGLTDRHEPLRGDEWFLPRLKEVKALGLTLEFSQAGMESISASIDIVGKAL